MNSQIRNHEYMISHLLEELSRNYNKIYNLKGIRKQKKGDTSPISTEELQGIKYMVDTKLTEIIEQAIELRRLIGELNQTLDLRFKQIKINPDTQICYKDEEFGYEYWTYSNCIIELRKLIRFSRMTTLYNKDMCKTIRRPFTVLGYEIKRIEQEYNILMIEMKKDMFPTIY